MTRPDLTDITDGPASSDQGDGGLVRYRIDLAYDGTGFAGWARQPGQRTVQGVVEDALTVVVRPTAPVVLTVAGRTDAGVHARGQVAHVDLAVGVPAGVVRRMNGVLPDDVVVRSVEQAPAGFEARFSALWRRYAYRVVDGFADPIRRHDTAAHSRALDIGLLAEASASLLGEHDFAAFCKRREGASTVRRLLSFGWVRDDAGVLVATVEADAFCHTMVRSLVGAVLPVGEKRQPLHFPGQLLASRVRDATAMVAPARGLTLEHVAYPPDDQLAARAVETRAYRGER